jgi:hypothetical protein
MNPINRILYILLLCSFCPQITEGQETVPATGGTATGIGGTATYTAGQIVYSVFTGTTCFIIQGVQQPYEISTVTAIENTEDITLECTVYPNPTEGIIRLVIKSFEDDNMRFRLYDMNGFLLQDINIKDKETVISMENLTPAIYYLKVIKDKMEVKVFKIVKN